MSREPSSRQTVLTVKGHPQSSLGKVVGGSWKNSVAGLLGSSSGQDINPLVLCEYSVGDNIFCFVAFYPRAPSYYLNGRLFGYVTIGYLEPRTHS